MKQLTLQYPLSHSKDPITSHKAAEKVVKSGMFHYSVEEVRKAIKRYCNVMMTPDFTAKEVAEFISREDRVDYFKLYIVLQKRKSILKHECFIKETELERDGCAVWRLT